MNTPIFCRVCHLDSPDEALNHFNVHAGCMATFEAQFYAELRRVRATFHVTRIEWTIPA
jgi:hypothetical protein